MPDDGTPNLPAVRSPRPPYIEAFEKFTQGKNDQVEAFVAFGLFISSEYSWAAAQPAWPTDELTRNTYGRLLHDPELFESRAKDLVGEQRTTLIREHEKKYLDAMFQVIEQKVQNIAAHSSRKHFWKGVAEATAGAFCWMLISIVIAVGLAFVGIDVFHVLDAISRH
jgi:hypothetical protein